MEDRIVFRAIIEVLGKPKEHVESSLRGYIKKMREDDKYEILKEQIAPVKKRDEEELWAVFAELEIAATKIENITLFCFEYMPALIEVVEPKKINLTDGQLTMFLNDIQVKLHHVDMVAKQVKMELDLTKRSMGALLKNYLTVLLGSRRMSSEKLGNLTGMNKDLLEDFLDKLIDEGKVDLEKGEYFLKKIEA